MTLAGALALIALRAALTSPLAITLPGTRLDVTISGSFDLPQNALIQWIERSAHAVALYYGGAFPVEHATIAVSQGSDGHVGHGITFPNHVVRIEVGRHATRAAFTDDWVMTHELTHLAFPTVPDAQHWMQEGMATYTEPLGRLRAGDLTPQKVWGDMVEGLPQGLPQAGDRGLDRTPTWGRTYWGGCLFFLLADVEIRRRTHNLKGLEHALRAIAQKGGSIDADWSPEKVVSVGDAGTGVPVLAELYRRMANDPAPVDLDALWKRLGVLMKEGRVTFDDHAPDAAIRQAISRGSDEPVKNP